MLTRRVVLTPGDACLVWQRGFSTSPEDLRLLKDNAPTASLMPTRANILRGVDWLVKGAKAGDALFFHFSGHGTQQKDEDANEADGMDEALVPSDHEKAGLITDDQVGHQPNRTVATVLA